MLFVVQQQLPSCPSLPLITYPSLHPPPSSGPQELRLHPGRRQGLWARVRGGGPAVLAAGAPQHRRGPPAAPGPLSRGPRHRHRAMRLPAPSPTCSARGRRRRGAHDEHPHQAGRGSRSEEMHYRSSGLAALHSASPPLPSPPPPPFAGHVRPCGAALARALTRARGPQGCAGAVCSGRGGRGSPPLARWVRASRSGGRAGR